MNEDDVVMLKLKTGDLVVGFLESETLVEYFVSSMMQLKVIEHYEAQGIGFIQYLPFDDGQEIQIMKSDVLFKAQPAEIIVDIYLDKVDELSLINSLFADQYYKRKKKKDKALN